MCDRHTSDYIPVECHSNVVCRLCYIEYFSKNVRAFCDNCGKEICGVVCQPLLTKSLPNSIHQGKYILACPKCVYSKTSYEPMVKTKQ